MGGPGVPWGTLALTAGVAIPTLLDLREQPKCQGQGQPSHATQTIPYLLHLRPTNGHLWTLQLLYPLGAGLVRPEQRQPSLQIPTSLWFPTLPKSSCL
jgi:hypothetical protein